MQSLPVARMGLRTAWSLLGLALLALLARPAAAQQIHRNSFESLNPSWVKSSADAPYEETAHKISSEGARNGLRSEFLQIQAKQGNYIYFQYGIGRGQISEEFSAKVAIKANRPGVQLLARLILPKERDPNNLENRLSTMIRGDIYNLVGRWQDLTIPRPQQLAKQVQQFMQAQLKRPVDFTDAYVDALVLNVYTGPGATEVWIDDLEVGPVTPEAAVAVRAPESPATPRRNQVVEFNGSQLLVGGNRIVMRGVRHTDTPLRILRDAGFNTLLMNYSADAKEIKEAVDLGFWLVPQLKVLSDDARLSTPDGIAQEVGRYAENDAVLFWHLENTLKFEHAVPIARAANLVKGADPGRPLGADVWDGLLPYSRSLNLLGVHRWPLMSTLELTGYREWLDMRRRLAQPGTFMWTWIQTHMPDTYTQILYDRPGNDGFNEPVGPQAEQIRLLAYTALAAGYKGLGFWSDRWLADSHQGRDRLLCCALLNQELDMLEPYLVQVDDAPQWIETSVPDVKAAILRTPKGILVLPIWLGKGGQFVPGQAAFGKVSIKVPQVPQSMQAWEVNPADVRSLRAEREVGGTKITLTDFGLTSAIVFTADTKAIVRFQEQARSRRQLAAQWSYDLALYEFEKVRKVQEQLVQLGQTVPDAAHLTQDAENRLRSAKQLWDTRVFAESYRESQRAMRPVRILMRAQWDKATKSLDTPVASPYAVNFFSLPRHWQFMEQVGRSVPSTNVLPGGDFEIISQRTQDAWRLEEDRLDDVELLAVRVGEVTQRIGVKGGAPVTGPELPREGKQCAMLQIRPRGKNPAPAALERAVVALVSPTVKLPPGSLVQVSGWVRVPEDIKASPDGALLYDSAGGDALGIRLTEATAWKKFTLYRRIPASGSINVTLALTGLGSVYFDDIRIEPLIPNTSGTPVNRN